MTVLLSEMTWPEAEEMFSKAHVAVVPTGSHEQHGPHLWLQQDTAVATWLAREAAEALYPRVMVAPPIAFGYGPSQMGFPGSMTLRIKTLVDLSVDIHRSLHRHGMERIVTLNAHAGEAKPLYLASRAARDYVGGSTAYVDVWDFLPADVASRITDQRVPGHGGEYETSLAMYLFPEGVRPDRIESTIAENLDDRLPMHHRFLTRGLGEYSKTGVYSGDPSNASAELGSRLAKAAVEGLVSFLEEFIRSGDELREAD